MASGATCRVLPLRMTFVNFPCRWLGDVLLLFFEHSWFGVVLVFLYRGATSRVSDRLLACGLLKKDLVRTLRHSWPLLVVARAPAPGLCVSRSESKEGGSLGASHPGQDDVNKKDAPS